MRRKYYLREARIRALLDEALERHQQFAHSLKTGPEYWSKLLNGRRSLSVEMRQKLLAHPLVIDAGLTGDDLWFVQEVR